MIKRSISLEGHRTSICLEPEFWAALETVSYLQQRPLIQIVTEIDNSRTTNLASALRVYALNFFSNLR